MAPMRATSGTRARFASSRASATGEHLGIIIIHQELALAPQLSIAENMFLGNEGRRRRGHRLVRDHRTRPRVHGEGRPQGKPVGADHQYRRWQASSSYEIAKALAKKVKAAHPRRADVELERERQPGAPRSPSGAEGAGHHLDHDSRTSLNEIAKIADQITILRDGSTVETLDCHTQAIDEGRIIKGMVGREMSDRYPKRTPHIGDGAAVGQGLERPPPHPHRSSRRQGRQHDGAQGRGGRHRRPDGRRAHRVRHVGLRPRLWSRHHRHGRDRGQAGRRAHRAEGDRGRHLPTSPRTASSSA